MTVDPLPTFAGAHTGPAGRRLLARALARPSLAALVFLAVVVLFFGLRTPGLLASGGLASVLGVAATVGIGGVAVALLLIAGQFDLSIGAVAVAGSLVTGVLVHDAGWGIWPALGVSLLGALAVGLANGLLVVSTGLPSFLTTLATYLLLEGATLAVVHRDGSTTVAHLSDARGWASANAVFHSTLQLGDGRYSITLLWWLGVTAAATWMLWRTRFGNAVFATGGARRAARELGVAVRRTTVTLFCLTAVAGWLIGTFTLVGAGQAHVTAGLGQEIGFVVVAVIGGCLLTGGYGSTMGALYGALVYAVAQVGMQLSGWADQWFEALLGGLLLVALLANGVVRSRLRAAPRS